MSDFDLQRILAGVVAKFGVKKLGELDFAKLAEVLPESLEVEQVEDALYNFIRITKPSEFVTKQFFLSTKY